MFEAFMGQRSQAIRLRRLAGHAIAIGLHALAIGAAVQLGRAPASTRAVPPARAVPVHLGLTLSEACLRRAPAAARAPASAPAVPPAPRPRRRPTAPARPAARAAEALALRGPTPMSDVDSAAPTTAAMATPTAERLAPGTVTGAAGTAAASTVNHVEAAAVPAPRAPRFLPEPLAQQQRIAGAPPEFPPSLATGGATFVIHARICVAPDGHVDRVELLRTADPTLDGNVLSAVGHWRYRPLLAGGIPVPFCTLVRFEFRAT